ncbi:MAG: hypothetical protein ABJA76_12280 [Mucilaginibacter sp.]
MNNIQSAEPFEQDVVIISIEQYNQEIGEAVARVKAGDFYSQEEVDEMSKDW